MALELNLENMDPEVIVPTPLNEEGANRIVAYLGSRPWAEVDVLITDLQELIETFMINHHLAKQQAAPSDVIQNMEAIRNANTNG